MADDANPSVTIAGSTAQGQKVAAHWARLSLTVDRAIQSLRSRGIAPEQATAEDLHALDMMHMGGLKATDALAEMAGISGGTTVLDVGSGVGGPARRFADRYGATVWGVELAKSSYQTSVRLTELIGLRDRVQFKHGSALALPFGDEAFDVVVMAHVAMQIAEKDQLFGECVRVLKAGGVLALHEIFAGVGGPPHFPLAWATEPAMSSLETFAACAARLAHMGLQVGPFVDRSEEGRQFHEANSQARRQDLAQQQGTEGRSVEVTEARLRSAESMERNLREGRLQVGIVMCHKRPK
jgi:ubiquinone/menaquinone biosynthesis C-methylase UbiE